MLVLAAAAVACGGPAATSRDPVSAATGAEGEGDGRVGGGRFLRADVERAIAAEQEALAALDARIAAVDADDSDQLAGIALRADRVARGAFVAQLEACLASAGACPPSLDEPATPSEWDADSGELRGAFGASAQAWPEDAARLEREACGCRTADCVAWVMADLERREAAVPPSVQGEDEPAARVTAARACLWRRLGR